MSSIYKQAFGTPTYQQIIQGVPALLSTTVYLDGSGSHARQVPSEVLPSERGVLVVNVSTTVYSSARALLTVMPTDSHLPAAMIASFVKRLARLSLSAPPAAIIMIIPFVYNLLKRHSSCMCMLQRDADDAESQDTYDEYEKDPMNTHALESSLWELKALQRHYLSHVATMSKVFQEVFTKPEFQMEDFLDHGYATVSSMRKATCDTHADITRYSYSKRKSSED